VRIIIIIITLFINLQSLTKADDISDFEIEGLSIGDSLLNHFSVMEIKNFQNYDDLPSDMSFRIIEIFANEMKMELYDSVQIYYKPNDKTFKIQGVNGGLFCDTKNMCINKYDEIKKDISKLFGDTLKSDNFNGKHMDDDTGKSIYEYIVYYHPNGEIAVGYTDWAKHMNYNDNVSIDISTQEVSNWVKNNYGLDG
tara:strand:- start:324 stop:911 length:588 start_codon:yes stop_codon:yes gene_type:complete